MDNNFYSLMKVARQSEVKVEDVCDETGHIGYEPQSELELKEPGRFSLERLIGILEGKAALHKFKEGDLVAVKLKHWGYIFNDEIINRIYIDDIKLVRELDHQFL